MILKSRARLADELRNDPNRSQSITNESLVDFRMQKWKLRKSELRLRGEIRLFRPENP